MHVAELPGTTVRRRNPDGTATNVPCPPLLPDYQQYMRGVDRGDQLIGCYNIGRRSKKWWKIIFSYIIECSLVNAYILERYAEPLLYRPSCTGRKKRDFLSFRLDIAEQLIGTHNLQQRSGRQPQHDSLTSPRLDPNRRHLPVQVESKARCVVCSAIQSSTGTPNRHESRIQCSFRKVHLCVQIDRNCFQKYHTLPDYSI